MKRYEIDMIAMEKSLDIDISLIKTSIIFCYCRSLVSRGNCNYYENMWLTSFVRAQDVNTI